MFECNADCGASPIVLAPETWRARTEQHPAWGFCPRPSTAPARNLVPAGQIEDANHTSEGPQGQGVAQLTGRYARDRAPQSLARIRRLVVHAVQPLAGRPVVERESASKNLVSAS